MRDKLRRRYQVQKEVARNGYFEGDIALPVGFQPFEVEIGIKPTTKKVKSFSETISWTRVLSEGV